MIKLRILGMVDPSAWRPYSSLFTWLNRCGCSRRSGLPFQCGHHWGGLQPLGGQGGSTIPNHFYGVNHEKSSKYSWFIWWFTNITVLKNSWCFTIVTKYMWFALFLKLTVLRVHFIGVSWEFMGFTLWSFNRWWSWLVGCSQFHIAMDNSLFINYVLLRNGECP